jgi:hypothetical protein
MSMTATVFFSYSHDDETYRDQLEKHLALLQRQSLIASWHDRRITVGKEVDASIDAALDSADIILLLVSASFLASNYCYSREMERAMERHHAGEATVVPVIVRDCDWHGAPFGKLLAAPRDGKPITSWANPDEAYADVARKIRALVESPPKHAKPSTPAAAARVAAPVTGVPVRSSNLRLKKTFTDLEKDTFLSEAYEFIAGFFETSLKELAERNPGVEGRYQRVDAQTFVASIYRHGKKQSACAIHCGGGPFRDSGITYSTDTSARGGSFNERLSVVTDDHDLFLRAMGMATFSGGNREEKLSMRGGAELLWSILIGHLQ